MTPLVLSLIQLLCVLILAPFTLGVRQLFLARLQGRQGAWPWMTYVYFFQLSQQENLLSMTQSWISRAVPYVAFGSAMFLSLVLPVVSLGGAFADMSNFLIVIAVLTTGSVALALAALDSGKSLAGASTSRYLTMCLLWLPAMFLVFAALAVATGQTSLDGMLSAAVRQGNYLTQSPYILVSLLALALIALADTFRYPVDAPGATYELSGMYDNLISHVSGPYLLLFEYAAALRYTVYALLIANFLFPHLLLSSASDVTQGVLSLGMTMIKLIGASAGVAILEMTIARLRFYRIQEFLTGIFFLALTGFALTLLSDLL